MINRLSCLCFDRPFSTEYSPVVYIGVWHPGVSFPFDFRSAGLSTTRNSHRRDLVNSRR